MKRLHIHIQTDDLPKSVQFYTALLGTPPEKQRADYARWLLDDPRAHISVSSHGGRTGLDHVGISIDTPEELEAYRLRFAQADTATRPEPSTTCCYAQSDKQWTQGPNGELWELFHTYGESDIYGVEPIKAAPDGATGHAERTGGAALSGNADPCCG